MAGTIDKRLSERGIELPPANAPAGDYVVRQYDPRTGAYADLGTLAAGGRTVPVYHTEGFKTILHIMQDSQTRFFFTNSPHFARQLVHYLSRLPRLEKIILLDNDAKVAIEECLRALRPGGKACFQEDGAWRHVVKQRPQNTD